MQPNQTSETLLPRAVRNQIKLVNDRLAANSAATAAPAEPTAQGAAVPTSANDAPGATAAAPTVNPSATPDQSAPAQGNATAREDTPEYWRDRFRVMQGINEKLRKEHLEALAVRDQELAELRQRVAQLEQQGASGTQQSNDSPPDIKLFFTDEQIERFGEEQCAVMAMTAIKAAREQAQRIIEAEVKPLKEAKKAEEVSKAKQAEDAFWSEVERLVAQIPQANGRTVWEIDEEPEWREWLAEQGDDGVVRQRALHGYQRTLNARGVVKLVREYLEKKHPNPPAPPVAPGGGAGTGSDQHQVQGPTVNGKGYPSEAELKDYAKRAATIRDPRDPRYVTDKERQEMEARLRLPRPGVRR